MALASLISKAKPFIRVCVEISIFFLGLIAVFLAKSQLKPASKDFLFDRSMQYPYKENSVSQAVTVISSSIVIIVNIFLVEFYRKKTDNRQDHGRFSILNRHPWIGEIYRYIMVTGFHGVALVFLVYIGKKFVGKPRPHLGAVCQLGSRIGYQLDSSCILAADRSAEDEEKVRESFPSGHAACVLYSATFLMIYNQWRIVKMRSLKRVLHVSYIFLAFYVAMSRVVDNQHHASDVIAGGILGLAFAVMAHWCLAETRSISESLQGKESNIQADPDETQ